MPSLGAPRAAAAGAILAMALLAGCARRTTPESPAPGIAAVDTVWYISARARVDGRDSRLPSATLEHGFVVYAAGEAGAPPRTLVDSVQLTEADFLRALRDRRAATVAPDDFAVLYVHGFGTSLHEAWEHTAAARFLSGRRVPWIVFCWPSTGSGFAPPRRGALLARAYHDDSASAAASIPLFARAAAGVVEAIGAPHTVITAHSLGSQLVGDALATQEPLRLTLGAAPLRAIAFVAADVEATRFGDYHVPALHPLARRIVLYASRRDRVLALSRRIHGSERAGLRRGPALLREGLETIDASEGFTREGWWARVFGTHHALKRASAVLFDLSVVIGRGAPAECRLALGTGHREKDGSWHLTPTPPAPGADTRCSSPGSAPDS